MILVNCENWAFGRKPREAKICQTCRNVSVNWQRESNWKLNKFDSQGSQQALLLVNVPGLVRCDIYIYRERERERVREREILAA